MVTRKVIRKIVVAVLAVASGVVPIMPFAKAEGGRPQFVSATRVAYAATAPILAATRAGKRLVAVGAHGVILLSDDEGRQWLQAKAVPFDGLLTAVTFADDKQGWAVGHAGVILHTQDGGMTWLVQRSDTSVDQPLFAVHFFDTKHGVAVGLWSLVLVTSDGGKSWQSQSLAPEEGSSKADLNLLSLFVDQKGDLYATAERGRILRSSDRGRTWAYLNTGYSGSLWSGVALSDGTLLVGGLRGSLYRSEDRGKTWATVNQPRKSSLTGFATVLQDGRESVFVTSLSGDVLKSNDHGKTFEFMLNNPHGANAITALRGKGMLLLTGSGPDLAVSLN